MLVKVLFIVAGIFLMVSGFSLLLPLYRHGLSTRNNGTPPLKRLLNAIGGILIALFGLILLFPKASMIFLLLFKIFK
jgi:hypothetical protein